MTEDDEIREGGGKIVGIIILAVVLVIVAGVCIFIFFTPGYMSDKSAIGNYFKAISEENSSLYKKSCYISKWSKNYNSGQSATDLDSLISEVFSFQSGATYDNVKIVSTEVLNDSVAESMQSSIQSHYGINVKISKVKRVNFSMTMTFDGETSDTGTISRYCYKSGGKWFFLADSTVILDMGLDG